MRFRFWLAVVGFSTVLAAPAFAQEEMPEECAAFASYDECLAAMQAGAPAEEPVYQEPAPEEPAYQEPAPEEPVYQEPAPEEPVYDEPAAEEPVYDEPAAEEPVYEEPAPEEPVYQEPAPEEPVYQEPAPEEPVYEEPAAEEPSDEPTSEEPVYDEPTPDEPVYDEPVPEPSVDEDTPDDTTAVETDTTQEDPAAEPETSDDEPAVVPDTTDEDTAVEPETTDEDTAVEPDASQEQTDVTADQAADPDLVVEDDADIEPMTTEALAEDDPIARLPAEELSTAAEPVAEGSSAEESAPLTDSGKERTVNMEADTGEVVEADTGEDVEAPESDETAQVTTTVTPEQIVADNSVKGARLADAPEQETPDNATINIVQNTYIYETNNTVIINNSYADRDRIFGGDDNYQFDQIGDNRFRETVYRDDGSVVVTTRDQYGNILERYRTDPYGDTYVLAYFDPAYYDDMDYWGDPGFDLPPLRITISIRDYALDWRYADADAIASFFAEPPLERARRVYSIDEVKRSARLRDSLRRLEVNDLNFASGAASLNRNQVNALSRLAEAMWTLLEQNPAETFLIEGHTDAKGSDRANLILSDQRASNVARILTQYYDIPPENLATQGYGERYLRIRTPRAEAQNRRVTIRRITPLVTPYFASR